MAEVREHFQNDVYAAVARRLQNFFLISGFAVIEDLMRTLPLGYFEAFRRPCSTQACLPFFWASPTALRTSAAVATLVPPTSRITSRSAIRGRVRALLASRAEHPNTQERAREDVQPSAPKPTPAVGRPPTSAPHAAAEAAGERRYVGQGYFSGFCRASFDTAWAPTRGSGVRWNDEITSRI